MCNEEGRWDGWEWKEGGGGSCIRNIHLGVSQVASILLEYEKLNNMRGEVCQSEEGGVAFKDNKAEICAQNNAPD